MSSLPTRCGSDRTSVPRSAVALLGAAGGLVVALGGCGSNDTVFSASGGAGGSGGTGGAGLCVPGAQVGCACPDGADGVQVCEQDGTRYGPCDCAGTTGSGGASGGAGGAGGTGLDGGGGSAPGGPSCDGMVGNECQGTSCCDRITVPGGSFLMGRSVSGTDAYPSTWDDEQPEHPATVATFALDRFEVTVGRFRNYVEQYSGAPPSDGDGAHPLIPGSGWQSAWNAGLPASKAQLISAVQCNPSHQTWTDNAGANEIYPINCVEWLVAFAFCVWDGGRLPTEAEWEYAAVGTDNRLFPWGQAIPTTTSGHANWQLSGGSPMIAVGSYPAGVGPWGHHDLAGSVWEWALDWWDTDWYTDPSGNPCNNCANLLPATTFRMSRGGGWDYIVEFLRGASRGHTSLGTPYPGLGLRCARR